MRGLLIVIAITFGILFSGCALMEKIVPSQTDAQGQVIPASHTPTEIAKTIAGIIPNGYGLILLTALGGGWNFIERVRANKLGTGLKATVLAIEQAGKDPATAEAIAKLKQALSNAHDMTGSQAVIKDILAKI